MPRFETKLEIRSAEISMKFLKNNIIKKRTKTELRAMPQKLLLSASLMLYFLGMGIIELASTTFVTGDSMYRFNVVTFGLVSAPRTHSRMVKMMLHGAKNMDNFVDDILTYTSSDFNYHLETLRELFMHAQQANITLRPMKAKVG